MQGTWVTINGLATNSAETLSVSFQVPPTPKAFYALAMTAPFGSCTWLAKQQAAQQLGLYQRNNWRHWQTATTAMPRPKSGG